MRRLNRCVEGGDHLFHFLYHYATIYLIITLRSIKLWESAMKHGKEEPIS